ncbi:hypothetical protein ACHAW5_004617 [Stephanodiscus triporus]|uniref:Fungal lipase-type domain-containing protein n=1 Tax=Stephanodiscus triporus TaxID=2934178 RepID=A0ABD3QVR3_9STRA
MMPFTGKYMGGHAQSAARILRPAPMPYQSQKSYYSTRMLTMKTAVFDYARGLLISEKPSSLRRRWHKTKLPKHEHPSSAIFVVAASVTIGISTSLYTRHLREKKLQTLVSAKDSGLLDTSTSSSTSTLRTHSCHQKYNLPFLIESTKRAGLVGSTKSVKDELCALREWHANRGYNGGIVVRDLGRPLFSLNSLDNVRETVNDDDENASFDCIGNIEKFNQRECYYLYYEIHSNGEIRQQIFCRGTTLLADVLTCLQTWFVYDEELGCRVHHGFNQHANRIVEDVLPLLVPPTDKSGVGATVEVCGHSLGGAVAMLVSIKLRKRGYSVTRVTSIAGPRFCRGIKERGVLEKWLPKEAIRIEDDLDIVTYLPPIGVSVGDKMWFAKDKAYILPKESLSQKNEWADHVWLNLCLFETILNQFNAHRIMSYVDKLEQLIGDSNDD